MILDVGKFLVGREESGGKMHVVIWLVCGEEQNPAYEWHVFVCVVECVMCNFVL